MQLMAGDSLVQGPYVWDDPTAEEVRLILESLDNSKVEIVEVADKINKVRAAKGAPVLDIGQAHEIGLQLSFLSKWLYKEAGMCDSYQVVSQCSECGRSLKKTIRPDMYGLHLLTYAYQVRKSVGLEAILEKEIREAVWDAGAASCVCGKHFSRAWPVLPDTLYLNVDCRNQQAMDMLDVEREIVVWGVAYRVTGVAQHKSNHFRTVRSTGSEDGSWVILDSSVQRVAEHKINNFLNPHRIQDRWRLAAIRIDRVEAVATRTHRYSYMQTSEPGIKTYLPKPPMTGGSSEDNSDMEVSVAGTSSAGTTCSSRSASTLYHKELESVVLQWNTNGTIGKRAQLQQYIRGYDPLIVVLSEPRTALDLNGYSSFESKQAEGHRQHKLNAQILIKGVTDFKTVIKEVNVCAISSLNSLGLPALVVGLYLHPDDETTNQFTRETVYRTVVEFLQTNRNQEVLLIVAGDFNMDLGEILKREKAGDLLCETLMELVPSSSRNTSFRSRSPRTIDWIFSNVKQSHIDVMDFEEGVSDHRAVASRISLRATDIITRVPSRQSAAVYLNKMLQAGSQADIRTFNQLIKQEIRGGRRPYRNVRVSDSKRSNMREQMLERVVKQGFSSDYYAGYRSQLAVVADNRFSANSGMAFQLARRLTKYNTFQKRDGGLVIAAYHQGRLLNGHALDEALLRHYQNTHSKLPDIEPPDKQMPRINPPVETVIRMMNNVSQDKGIVFDGVTDHWFKLGKDKECLKNRREGHNFYCSHCQRKVQFAASLLQSNYWSTEDSRRHHEARLVCLNKVHPKVPELSQYRPIIVSSPIIKFIEGFIAPSLKQWMKRDMVRNAFGFRPGRSTEDARQYLLGKLVLHREAGQPVYVVFFDISSAYDNVDRRLLRDLLDRYRVLSQSQMELWQWLATSQRVRLGSTVIETTNGIPQGSTLAPGLWNVYMQPLMVELAKLNQEKVAAVSFADDLACVTTSWWLAREVIRKFEAWCQDSNMTPNRAKSGIMYMDWKRGSLQERELWGYPVVRQYKYLGGWLDHRLQVAGHLQHISRKISFLAYKLTPLRLLKDLRLSINLFRTLCLPLYRMGLLNALITNATDRKQYFQAIRCKFKQFCYLPKCTPNEVVKMLLGHMEQVAEDVAAQAERHLERDRGGRPTGQPTHQTYYSKVPAALFAVLDCMYRSACIEHNRIMCRAELVKHNIALDLDDLLSRYQLKSQHCRVNRELRGVATEVRAVSQRFTSRTTLARPLVEEQDDQEESNQDQEQPEI